MALKGRQREKEEWQKWEKNQPKKGKKENECSNEKVEKVSFNKNLFGKLDEITQTIRKYYLVISFRKIFVLTFLILEKLLILYLGLLNSVQLFDEQLLPILYRTYLKTV